MVIITAGFPPKHHRISACAYKINFISPPVWNMTAKFCLNNQLILSEKYGATWHKTSPHRVLILVSFETFILYSFVVSSSLVSLHPKSSNFKIIPKLYYLSLKSRSLCVLSLSFSASMDSALYKIRVPFILRRTYKRSSVRVFRSCIFLVLSMNTPLQTNLSSIRPSVGSPRVPLLKQRHSCRRSCPTPEQQYDRSLETDPYSPMSHSLLSKSRYGHHSYHIKGSPLLLYTQKKKVKNLTVLTGGMFSVGHCYIFHSVLPLRYSTLVRLPSGEKASFLGAFAKLRKATISFMSVCPHGTTRLILDGFWQNLILPSLRKSVEKFKFH